MLESSDGLIKRWYATHPVIVSMISLLMMISPLIVGMRVGFSLIEWVWPAIADSADDPWAIPYLVGIAVGSAAVLAINRLERTKVAWVLVHFDAWLGTLRYPMHSDDKRDPDE